MSSARVLTTVELGAVRYAESTASRMWPVEVKYRDSLGSFSFGDDEDVSVMLSCSAEFDPEHPIPSSAILERAARGEWRAVVELPVGSVTYAIIKDNLEVAAGGLTIDPPDAPNTSPSNLRTAAASGARQLGPENFHVKNAMASGKPALWSVEFMFAEVLWAVREVWLEVEDEDPQRMNRNPDGTSYTVVVALPPGERLYRFRAVMKDSCRPDTGPWTRLGWDSGVGYSSGLSTWDLSVTVNDLTTGAKPGSCIVHSDRFVSAAMDDERTKTKAEAKTSVQGLKLSASTPAAEPPKDSAATVLHQSNGTVHKRADPSSEVSAGRNTVAQLIAMKENALTGTTNGSDPLVVKLCQPGSQKAKADTKSHAGSKGPDSDRATPDGGRRRTVAEMVADRENVANTASPERRLASSNGSDRHSAQNGAATQKAVDSHVAKIVQSTEEALKENQKEKEGGRVQAKDPSGRPASDESLLRKRESRRSSSGPPWWAAIPAVTTGVVAALVAFFTFGAKDRDDSDDGNSSKADDDNNKSAKDDDSSSTKNNSNSVDESRGSKSEPRTAPMGSFRESVRDHGVGQSM